MKQFLSVLIILVIMAANNILEAQNQYWLRDITGFAGLDSAHGSRIVVADVNNDNYPDLLWGTGNAGKNRFYLYLNIENPDKLSNYRRVFKDFTVESGINKNRNTGNNGRIIDVASFADVDNDGDKDLITSIYYHRLEYYKDTLDPGDRSEVFLNDGTGKFTLYPNNGLWDMNVLNWLPKGLVNTAGLSILDYDLDGFVDLYMATWFGDRANGIGMPDLLFKGNGNGAFTNTNMKIFTSNYYPMYGVNVTDWDNDGWPDILTSPYCNSNSNLFRNLQNGTFQDYAQQANFSAIDMKGDNGQELCQWEAQPADYDNDGDMDILQVFVHGGYDANEGRTRVLTNLGPDSGYKYNADLSLLKRDAPNNSHLGDQGGQWIDVDGDGFMDIVIGQMAYPQANTQGQERLYVCRQFPGETPLFRDITKAMGLFSLIKEAHSMEPVDFDLDGDQDLFVSHQVRDTTFRDTVINGSPAKVVASINNYMQVRLLENKVSDVDHLGSDYHRWISVKATPPAGCNKNGIGTRIKVFANGKSYMQDIQAGLGHFAGQQPFIRNFGLGFDPVNIDSIVVHWPNKSHTTTVAKGMPLNTVIEIDETGYKNNMKTWNMKQPVLAINNSNLNFGTVNVGNYREILLTLSNPGETALTISSITSFTDSSVTFTTPVTLPITIQPGNQLNLTARFAPVKRKQITGDIIIKSNAFNDSIAKVTYFAYGFENKPIIASETKTVDFGTIYIDSTAQRTISLENTGELDLIISEIQANGLPPEFNLDNLPNLPVTINPGKKLSFSATFSPSIEAEYGAIIVIRSNAYNDDSYHITIKGEGESRKPQIFVVTQNVLFGNISIGETREKSVKIRNTGNAGLTINQIEFEKPFSQNYEFLFQLPLTISPNEEKDLDFNFKPTEVQSYKTNIYIKSNSYKDSTVTIAFVGNGKDPTSVREDVVAGVLTITPMPASGITKIIAGSSIQRIDNVMLYDLMGASVEIEFLLNPQKRECEFDASSLPSGFYVIAVLTEKGFIYKPILIE